MMGRIDAYESSFGKQVEEVTADRGYGYGENLHALHQRDIKALVPRFHEEAGERVQRDSEGFTFDKKQDCYICPQGHKMFPYKGSTARYK